MTGFQFTHTASGGDCRQQIDRASRSYNDGKALHHDGNYEAALEAYRQALAIREPYLGKYHWDTIKTYWRMGRSHWLLAAAQKESSEDTVRNSMEQKEQQQAAIRCWRRSLRMAERLAGKDHAITKSLYADVGSFLSSASFTVLEKEDASGSNRSLGARKLKSKTVPLLKAIEDFLTAERQGDLLTKSEDYYLALKQYETAMKLEQKIFLTPPLGEDMDSTVSTKNSVSSTSSTVSTGSLDGADVACKMASLYKMQGDTKSSVAAFESAHGCYQQFLGEDHPASNCAAANLRSLQDTPESGHTPRRRSRGLFGLVGGGGRRQ